MISIPIKDIHGRKCFFTNSSYNCPGLQLYGFSTERALSRRIARMERVLKAQHEACLAYARHLDEEIYKKRAHQ